MEINFKMNIDYSCAMCDITGVLRWLPVVLTLTFILLFIALILSLTKKEKEGTI